MDERTLRDHAESLSKSQPLQVEEMSREQLEHLVHELQVHQIELELQNEEMLRLQSQLKTSERLYFELYHLAPVGYITLDASGCILQINLKGSQLLGSNRQHLSGRPLSPCLTVESGKVFFNTLQDLFLEARSLQTELTLLYPDGTTLVVWAECVPYREQEKPLCLMTLTDINERKRMEQKLEAQAQALQESNANLDKFAQIVAHDFKEPLRLIRFFAQTLAEDLGEEQNEFIQESLEILMSNSILLQEMVDAILSYAKVRRSDEHEELADMNEVLSQVLDQLALAIHEAEAEIHVDPLPVVRGNRALLARVFQNLITNAIKFRSEDPPEIHIAAKQHNGSWMFSVRDNGIGLEPAHSERIFEVFRRLHLREEYPGLGIGLAMCKRIVEQHNGSIWVESQPGKGATFLLTLPT